MDQMKIAEEQITCPGRCPAAVIINFAKIVSRIEDDVIVCDPQLDTDGVPCGAVAAAVHAEEHDVHYRFRATSLIVSITNSVISSVMPG
jgi:hypothetical protein